MVSSSVVSIGFSRESLLGIELYLLHAVSKSNNERFDDNSCVSLMSISIYGRLLSGVNVIGVSICCATRGLRLVDGVCVIAHADRLSLVFHIMELLRIGSMCMGDDVGLEGSQVSISIGALDCDALTRVVDMSGILE